VAKGDVAAVWKPERRPWGRADALALLAWSAAVAVAFWDAVTLRGALFYFDVTEINYPYRDFFARELRAGRFSRWIPGLYCGHPLYSESQAGYLHPLKYLLYPWLPTWAAFNLDTVLSIWLTGMATYGWLRRHVGPAGALSGAAVFGLSGFAWAHLVHTSMINAMASVPLAFWALECAWDGGRLRGVALGAVALACQVFAGHLQDTILTGSALGVYGLYRAATERGARPRAFALGTTAGLGVLAVALSAVQWMPSKELIDRSPRAGGLSWEEMTYGSWHPELLPTLLVREAYGTRARDTDWMDGFYPYHEMNSYLGVVGLALAVVGAAAYRDRWVGFWPILAGLGLLLMLGRFTFLMDRLNRVPILGSGRIPVRYHLWVSLAVAALAAVGVDRLSRPGRVALGGAVRAIAGLALVSIPILAYVYAPVWTQPDRWTRKEHRDRYRWLGEELARATVRTATLAALAGVAAAWASRSGDPRRRARIAALLPGLAIADLVGAHLRDAPTVTPKYWTTPPPTAVALRADPTRLRIFGMPTFHSGEPGYASEPRRVDFLPVRDVLAWSLPPVWGLDSTGGETPIFSARRLRFTDVADRVRLHARFDVEGLTHFLSGSPLSNRRDRGVKVGAAYLYTNPTALPRARLLGRPVYAADERAAGRALRALGDAIRARVIVEDPDRPLPEDATASGAARIVGDAPERVEVGTRSDGPSYLFLADTYDPGWSATLDGRPVPIRPADVAFRAVYVPAGRHTVVFTYCPAGFRAGLILSLAGLLPTILLLAWPRPVATLGPAHGDSGWPRRWPLWGLALIIAVIAASTIGVRADGGVGLQSRWSGRTHRFTWGAGIEAIRPPRPPLD
jgi:hypothetical protein